MAKHRSPKPVLEAIATGAYDNCLGQIADAIGARLRSSGSALRWKVTVDDVSISEDDITLNEAVHLEEVLGKTWATISPTASARDCRSIVAVALAERGGLKPDQVSDRLKDFTLDDALDALSVY